MTKEYLGEEAVNDLFDIISENFVSKEEIEMREKSLACAISVGAALIAAALLKSSENIADAKETVGKDDIATDEEFNSMLDETLGNADGTTRRVISDEAFNSMLDSLGI